MPIFRNAQFEISIAKAAGLPPPVGAEIAFAGRSNAGKSSAINTLAGHTRLAFVSKTPGRTQLINFFRLNCGAALVDLPGYGYAKVPESIRRQWQGLLETYLRKRENLIGLVLIMDSRHPLTPLDHQMIGWFAATGRPIHVLLTKSDKLSRNQASAARAFVQRELADLGPQVSVQLFSSLNKIGMEEVEQTVAGWLGLAADTGSGVSMVTEQPGDAGVSAAAAVADGTHAVRKRKPRTTKENPGLKGKKARGETPS